MKGITVQEDALIEEGHKVYSEHFPNATNFERAIFFSWGCSVNDCTFCYMSTQTDRSVVPKSRHLELISFRDVHSDIMMRTARGKETTPNENTWRNLSN